MSAIVWNAVRDGNGITVRHQWNAHDWISHTAPSMDNPHLPPGWMEEQRETMPELVFAQEVLAQFVTFGAGLVIEKVARSMNFLRPIEPRSLSDFPVFSWRLSDRTMTAASS